LDVAKTYADRDEAIAAGKAANQKSIYDLAKGKEIKTEGTGEATPKATPETAKMSDAELLKHGFTKEDIDAGKHLPTVSGAKALPTGDDLIKKYGESSGDPAHTVFILKDGRGVRNTGSDHDVMLGGKATDTNPPREKFIADGNIRVRPRMGAGREVSLSIPESGINTKQLAYIEKMAPQLRSGAVLIEVGKPGGEYRILSQGEATPEALGKVLNELAPMKNAKGSPIDEYGNPTVSGGSQAAGTAKAKEWAPPKDLEKGIPHDEPVHTEIPLNKISVSKQALDAARDNAASGRGTKTKGPVSVFYNTDNGQFLIEDGMHRIAEAHSKGKTSIPATLWSGYSDTIANVRPEDRAELGTAKAKEALPKLAEEHGTSFDPNRFHTTTTDVMEQPGKKKSPLKKM